MIHLRRERFSKVPDAIEGEHLPAQVSYDDDLQSGRDPGEDDADELPWDGYWQLVQKWFGFANQLLDQLSGGWSQTILQAAVVTCGHVAKFLETTPETAYGSEMNIQVHGATALVHIPAVSVPIVHSLKTCDIRGTALINCTF